MARKRRLDPLLSVFRLGDTGAELLELTGQCFPNDRTVIDDEDIRLMIHEYGSSIKHGDRRGMAPFWGLKILMDMACFCAR